MPFGGGANLCQPSVARVADALHEAVFLQAGYDPCHRWRLHLLRSGELAEGERSAEDDYRKSGKAGSRQPAGIILPAQLPEEVNRGRVEPVGERFRSRLRLPGRHSSGRRRCPAHH